MDFQIYSDMQITTIDQLKDILSKVEEKKQILITYATDSGLTVGFSKTDLSNTKLFKIVEKQKVNFNMNYVQTIKQKAEELGNENPEYNITDRGKQINANYTWILPDKIRQSKTGEYYFVYYPIQNETPQRVTTYAMDGVRNTTKLKDLECVDDIMDGYKARSVTAQEQKIIDTVQKPRTNTVSKPQSDMGIDINNSVDFRMVSLSNLLEIEMDGTIYELYFPR